VLILEDGQGPELIAANGAAWRVVTDRVMGGVSEARLTREMRAGHSALVLRGTVRLDNDGGFVQMALDLAPAGGALDASGFRALRLSVQGNGAGYNVHLRTRDLTRVWQSYRANFVAEPRWQVIDLPLSEFSLHRTDIPLDLRQLHRIGLVAIGEPMQADLALGAMALVS
jgi:hypothetical protein